MSENPYLALNKRDDEIVFEKEMELQRGIVDRLEIEINIDD
jgi:hypothetical protein